MAIVKLHKVTLYGIARQRDEVLERLQGLGCLHLIDLQEKSDVKMPEHPHRSVVHDALKYLNACPVQNSNQLTHYEHDCDCLEVSRRALEIKQRRQELSDERDHLVRSIEALEPWGNFEIPPDEELGGLRLWFYLIRRRQVSELANLDLAWQAVNEDHQFVYAVVVSPEEPQRVPGTRVELDRRPLAELKARLEQVDEDLETLHWLRVKLTRCSSLMSRDLDEAEDEVARMEALQRLVQDDHLFALQGWAARTTLDAVRDFAAKHQLAVLVERPSPEDQPPTLLKNPKAVAGAEGAVTFYITPNYRAWDPTIVLFFSFALFFAMIMSDAGYGLALGIMLFFLWGRMAASEGSRRFRTFLAFLVAMTIGYGVLIGSYFGFSPPEGGLLDSLVWKAKGQSIMHDDNQQVMMLLAASIGVLHLALANLITSWQNRGKANFLGNLGWSAALLGGLFMGVSQTTDANPQTIDEIPLLEWTAGHLGIAAESLQAVLWQGGTVLLIVGLAAVLLFTSNRSLLSTRIGDWIWRVLEGLQGLTNISKAFGDSLSYLRLFALGLASAKLAVTFNDLAGGVRETPGVGLFLALLIFLVGHTLNLVLGVVGGVVHGLRLNCIEFFSWCLTEEGYPFRAFSKKAGI